MAESETVPDDERASTRLVVIMFTDLADSAALARQLGDEAYVHHVLEPHNAIFRRLLTQFPAAREVKHTGDGFMATFASPSDAAQCALLFHHALRTAAWEHVAPQTRIGIHLGEAIDFAGPAGARPDMAGDAANMTARLMGLALPGQTLLTKAAFDSAHQSGRVRAPIAGGSDLNQAHTPVHTLPEAERLELRWLNHGRYRFKGAGEPFEVFEVGVVGEAPLQAPPDSEKARRVKSPDDAAMTFGRKVVRHWNEVFWQRRAHWLVVAMLIPLGAQLGRSFETNDHLFGLRYQAFEFLEELSARKLRADHTVVVLVDDDAYYSKELAGRVPLNRRYLARLVAALGELNPAVIAIDFDFRSPDASGKTKSIAKDGTKLPEFPDYIEETVELLHAIKEVSAQHHIPIVLPATIGRQGSEFVLDSDVYNGFDFGSANVARGYIALDTDTKVVPPAKRLGDGSQIDSFSLAIVRAIDEDVLQADQWTSDMFGGFIREDGIPRVSSGAVLHPHDQEALRKKIQHKVALIGGAWHRLGYRRGGVIDSYESPAGVIPGVLIHANYVEAVLDRRAVLPMSNWIVSPAEAFLAFLLAYALSLPIRPWFKASSALAVILLPILLSYVAIQNFGVYFDVFIVDLLLLGHFVTEKIVEWYQSHRRWLEYEKSRSAAGLGG
jgi:class 3 adenylate cyclase/CHASE2 domain-containing sensor protein